MSTTSTPGKRQPEPHILAWHFLPNDFRLKHDDQRLVEVGNTLSVQGDIIPCEHGLHASRRALDALGYTDNGSLVICRVECWGDVVEQGDKLACRHRKVLWMYDAEKVLHQFAVDTAREAMDLYAKDSDDPKVQKANVLHRKVLDMKQRWINGEMTDDEWDGAWDGAWDAAWDGAWDAARDAAWDGAWDAARDGARDAASGAAWGAASGAAWDAARDAARDAAWDAALDRLNARLEEMLTAGALVVGAVQS